MVEFNIPNDLTLSEQFEVTEEHSAAHLKSGTIAVLATPSMILFMEQTSRKALEEILPRGFSSVGIEVCVKHRKAVKIGELVKTEVKVVEVDGKKVKFDVKVTYNDEVVGDGTHQRYVIEEDKFMKSID